MTMHSGERRAERPGLLREPWTRLGLLGSTLAAGVLAVHVPASLWAGNLSEFSSAFVAFFALGLIAVIVCGLVMLGLCRLLPRPARAVLALLTCATGLVWWATAYFIGERMGALNGLEAPLSFRTALGSSELPVVAAVTLLLAIVIGRARQFATTMLVVLNAGLFAVTIVTLLFAGRSPLRGVATDIAPLYQFSSRGNVLVLLLDGLQSDVTDKVLRADPTLAAAFDGFSFYKDTMGVAPTTFMTMPAIHSGAVYDGSGNLPSYFTNAIQHESFLTRFAKAGYRAASINPLLGICPDGVATCTNASVIVRARAERIAHEAVRLLDLSLFRVAPVTVKRWLYADGNWFVATKLTQPFEVARIFEDHRLLELLGERISREDTAPTIKFLHLFTTHVPFVVKDDCRSVAPTHSFDQLESQSRCGLLSVAALLQRLKAHDVYDDTVILIMADHGIGTANAYHTGRIVDANGVPDKSPWPLMAGSANPTFLFKPRKAHGALREAAGTVHLSDVGATLCAETGACAPPAGTFAAGSAPSARVRRYSHYEWKHEFWTTRDVPVMSPYEVVGPVWDRGAWRAAAPMTPYTLGTPIALNAATSSDHYLQVGWGGAESWGRWTIGSVAQLSMQVERPAAGSLQLVAHTWAFVPPTVGAQNATWVINGQAVETWRFEPGNTLSERRLTIPRALLADDGGLRIALHISDPVSPQELELGPDPRPLGLAVADIALVPAPDDAGAGVVPVPVPASVAASTPQQ